MYDSLMLNGLSSSFWSTFCKQSNVYYNRLSFSWFLNLLRSTVVTDWDQCTKDICSSCFRLDSTCSIKTNCRQDLILKMCLCGVYTFLSFGPTFADVSSAALAPILPFCPNEYVSEQLCVTVRVTKEKLRVFTGSNADNMGTPALTCTFEGQNPGGDHWLDIFSAVQVTFGKWHGQTKEHSSYPYIEEDSSQLFGTSDMFISVYVPTQMLLQTKQSVPWVKCGLMRTSPNYRMFLRRLDRNLYFSYNKLTDKDVFITHYMPGMSALPAFTLSVARQAKPTVATTTVQLTQDGLKIDTLIRRVFLESPEAKSQLANPSSVVQIEFKSPLTALISVAQSEKFKIEFPVPVSPSKYKVRIARKSSYIEVETPLFNPLEEEAVSFMYPTFIAKVWCGTAVPIPWVSARIDLDALPVIDLKSLHTIPWLKPHIFQMFSERELSSRKFNLGAKADLRTSLLGQQFNFFGIKKAVGGIQTLILPSYLRFDLINHTFILDTAVVPVTRKMSNDPKMAAFLQELINPESSISEEENRAWKTMLPALVERCRTAKTWKHSPDCEYLKTGEVPLSRGVNKDGISSICGCGIGHFPESYLKSQMEKFPEFSYMVKHYATRAVIGPIFTVPYVENCSSKIVRVSSEACMKCGRSERIDVEAGEKGLMACARCKLVKYCSKECQKADWKNHKRSCKAA